MDQPYKQEIERLKVAVATHTLGLVALAQENGDYKELEKAQVNVYLAQIVCELAKISVYLGEMVERNER